jgi:hypothetical protein
MPVPSELMLTVGLKSGGTEVSVVTPALLKSPEYSSAIRTNCWLRLMPCALTRFTIVWRSDALTPKSDALSVIVRSPLAAEVAARAGTVATASPITDSRAARIASER